MPNATSQYKTIFLFFFCIEKVSGSHLIYYEQSWENPEYHARRKARTDFRNPSVSNEALRMEITRLWHLCMCVCKLSPAVFFKLWIPLKHAIIIKMWSGWKFNIRELTQGNYGLQAMPAAKGIIFKIFLVCFSREAALFLLICIK